MTMQPAELRVMRLQTGLTQEAFAAVMGVSRKALNEMEGGKAPIEHRSMMAARQAYNERARFHGTFEVTEEHDDVPLAGAMVLWDPEDDLNLPPVKVVDHPTNGNDRRYMSSAGACSQDWQVADDTWRMRRLLALFVQLTVQDRIPAADVHKAFSVIPEYRWTNERSLFDRGVDY